MYLTHRCRELFSSTFQKHNQDFPILHIVDCAMCGELSECQAGGGDNSYARLWFSSLPRCFWYLSLVRKGVSSSPSHLFPFRIHLHFIYITINDCHTPSVKFLLFDFTTFPNFWKRVNTVVCISCLYFTFFLFSSSSTVRRVSHSGVSIPYPFGWRSPSHPHDEQPYHHQEPQWQTYFHLQPLMNSAKPTTCEGLCKRIVKQGTALTPMLWHTPQATLASLTTGSAVQQVRATCPCVLLVFRMLWGSVMQWHGGKQEICKRKNQGTKNKTKMCNTIVSLIIQCLLQDMVHCKHECQRTMDITTHDGCVQS